MTLALAPLPFRTSLPWVYKWKKWNDGELKRYVLESAWDGSSYRCEVYCYVHLRQLQLKVTILFRGI